MTGRLVGEIASSLSGTGRATWNLGGVEAGEYFVRLSDEASSQVAKAVFAK